MKNSQKTNFSSQIFKFKFCVIETNFSKLYIICVINLLCCYKLFIAILYIIYIPTFSFIHQSHFICVNISIKLLSNCLSCNKLKFTLECLSLIMLTEIRLAFYLFFRQFHLLTFAYPTSLSFAFYNHGYLLLTSFQLSCLT